MMFRQQKDNETKASAHIVKGICFFDVKKPMDFKAGHDDLADRSVVLNADGVWSQKKYFQSSTISEALSAGYRFRNLQVVVYDGVITKELYDLTEAGFQQDYMRNKSRKTSAQNNWMTKHQTHRLGGNFSAGS